MSRKALTAVLLGSLLLLVISVLGVAQPDGEPLPIFKTAFFAGTGNCAGCHSHLVDEEGLDISFDTDWRSSIMANSARDPLWLAKVESEILRTATPQALIEYECATCHTLYTTVVDESGGLIEGVEAFPERAPFLEWKYSAFGDGTGATSGIRAICRR